MTNAPTNLSFPTFWLSVPIPALHLSASIFLPAFGVFRVFRGSLLLFLAAVPRDVFFVVITSFSS